MYDKGDMIKATNMIKAPHIWDQYLQSERDRDSAANTRFWKNTQTHLDKNIQTQITIEYFFVKTAYFRSHFYFATHFIPVQKS